MGCLFGRRCAMTTRWLCQSVLCASLGFSALHCGDPAKGGGPQPPGPSTELPPIGDAITAPMNTWTWVDFPDAVCDDGSPTGIGVNLNGSSSLFVFLMGGGACWDYTPCALFNTSAHGPFGMNEFNG